jgi:arginine exporter protein ArgO
MGRGGCLGVFIMVVVCFAIDVALLVMFGILTIGLKVRPTSGIQTIIGFITLVAAIYITYRLRQQALQRKQEEM